MASWPGHSFFGDNKEGMKPEKREIIFPTDNWDELLIWPLKTRNRRGQTSPNGLVIPKNEVRAPEAPLLAKIILGFLGIEMRRSSPSSEGPWNSGCRGAAGPGIPSQIHKKPGKPGASSPHGDEIPADPNSRRQNFSCSRAFPGCS